LTREIQKKFQIFRGHKNNKNNNNKKSYSLHNVVSVREEFWVSPWSASHAKNEIRGAYDHGGHFLIAL